MKKSCAIFILAILLCSSLLISGAFAFAETIEYTNVLEDLQKDETFDVSEYPLKNEDLSLTVIQIAESISGELFVYVYQPSGKNVTVSSINISQGIDDKLSYKNYFLTLLSLEGTLGKYRVDGLSLTDDLIRFYDFSAIYRLPIADEAGETDEGTSSGNANRIDEIVYPVAKRFQAATVNDTVIYKEEHTEIVEIINPYAGFIRYNNGYVLHYDACDAWYVAFNTDRNIDVLYEADVLYDVRTVTRNWVVFTDPVEIYGEWERNIVKTVTYKEKAQNPGGGLLGWYTYTWDRIETVDHFVANEQLTDSTEQLLRSNGNKWVLRFLETSYYSTSSTGATSTSYSEVSNVAVLRLKFRSGGKVYNLGAVSNKITDVSGTPDNTNTGIWDPIRDGNKGLNILAVILGIVIIVLIVLCVYKLFTVKKR